MDYCSTIVCSTPTHWASLRFIPRLRVACLTLPFPHAADLTISSSVSTQYEYCNVVHAGCRAITHGADESRGVPCVGVAPRWVPTDWSQTNAKSEACRAGPASSVSGHADMRWLLSLTNEGVLATSLEAICKMLLHRMTVKFQEEALWITPQGV